ncbi:MAG: galactose mutarotase [Lachnospiraceae bacterium]|nr:galactose mutarotase [Candidatus Colinaster scatohippi]
MKELYGITKDGKEVYSYSMENSNGMKAVVINYGAILDKLYVPDKNGNVVDVVLCSSNIAEYEADSNFFGATVGPSANRIANAEVPIDGVIYNMLKNDGENNLHSDVLAGIHKRIWDATEGENSVTFSIDVKDGEFGLPGNRTMKVTYTLTDDNGIKIDYYATSDKNTVYNMTNHSHFNLAGHNSGSVLDHVLTLNASKFTPVVAGAIPTGEFEDVTDSILGFTKAKRVGQDIMADNEQLKLVNGYDFNYIVDDFDGSLREIATLEDPVSGRIMKVISDQPGVQLYTDNWVENAPGKDGYVYQPRHGLCLETQAYPDSIHHDNFPDVVYGPGKDYVTTTIYRFE